jgi:hypothetical protein
VKITHNSKMNTDSNLGPKAVAGSAASAADRCPACNGRKEVMVHYEWGARWEYCPRCKGTGERHSSGSARGDKQSPAADGGWWVRSAWCICVLTVGTGPFAYHLQGNPTMLSVVSHVHALSLVLAGTHYINKWLRS